MKMYDQVRGDILVAIASFMDEYEEAKAIPENRQKEIEAMNKMVRANDTDRDAYRLRKNVKEYVDNMGFSAFFWMTGLSIYRLKQLMRQAITKPEYKKIHLLQSMYKEERENSLRIEEQLSTKCEKTRLKMIDVEKDLTGKLSQANMEILRLKREIQFLTAKLVECRKKLDTVQSDLDALKVSKAQANEYNAMSSQSAMIVRQSGLWEDRRMDTVLPPGERLSQNRGGNAMRYLQYNK